jgi:hypothetical protein
MSFQVIYATESRPRKTVNEDLVGIADGLFFVLDGSSVPPELPGCCNKDAAWYVRRLAAGLLGALAGKDDVKLAEGLATAIATVAEEHRHTCPPSAESLGPSAAVALVRHRADALDYLLLGDVTLLLQTDFEVAHHCDRRLSTVATETRMRIRSHLQHGAGYAGSEYRSLVLELVEAERRARNSADGYWIASNDPAAAYEAETGSVPVGIGAGHARRFAMLSDGLARGVDLLGVFQTWSELLGALSADGPARCIEAVRDAEGADPDGRRHPRTSRSDDATALLATLIPTTI